MVKVKEDNSELNELVNLKIVAKSKVYKQTK